MVVVVTWTRILTQSFFTFQRQELMRLHANYNTKMRAVRHYLAEETKLRYATSSADHLVVTAEEAEREFQECLAENDRWNKEIALIREKRLHEEREEKKNLILTRLDAKEERDRENRVKAEERVRLEKERAKTFIMRENMDEAIEVALANPVNHDFAIDLAGNIIHDKVETQPEKTTAASSTG